MQKAIRALKDKFKDHIDARDTERATLLSWPGSPQIQVDGDDYPYSSDQLVFADYLQDQEVDTEFEIIEGPDALQGQTLKGKVRTKSPLQMGDRLIVSRLSDKRYYVHGKAGS